MSFFFGIASGVLIWAWVSPASVGRWFGIAHKAFIAEVHKDLRP